MKTPESPQFQENIDAEAFDLPKYSIEGQTNLFQRRQLIDFDDLLREKADLEKTALEYSDAFAQQSYFHNFLQSRAKRLFSNKQEQEAYVEQVYKKIVKKIIERIKQETAIQDEIEGITDIGNIADIQNMIETAGIKKSFFAPEFGAAYYPLRGKIVLGKKTQIPDNKFVLSCLINGGFPNLFATLVHEMIHAEQLPPKNYAALSAYMLSGLSLLAHTAMINSQNFTSGKDTLIFPLIFVLAVRQYFKTQDKETEPLHEVQANSPEFNWDFYNSPRSAAIQHLQSGYRMATGKETNQIISASIDIDHLLALGFSHKQIARLCQGAKWDYNEQAYDKLHKAVEFIKSERGLTDEDLSSLMDARMLERKINRLKIQKITLEEIAKEEKNLSD